MDGGLLSLSTQVPHFKVNMSLVGLMYLSMPTKFQHNHLP